jgi:signal transduction histidine kinase/CheY-like chemotaxis protein
MSDTHAIDLHDELHISPQPILILLLLVASGLLVASYDMADFMDISLVAIGLSLVVGVCWAVVQHHRRLGTWMLVGSVMLIVDALCFGFGRSDLAVLRIVATGLAAILLGVWPAALVVGAETLITLLLPAPLQLPLAAHLVALGAIWGVWGLMFAAYRPAYRFAAWSTEQVHSAQQMTEESRVQRQQLKEALDDLAQANHQAALMNERLAAARLAAEEAQKAKAAFVAKVSHEFRTPLNLIIGLIDLIVETPGVYGPPLPDPLLEDMEIVHRSCEHLASMINDVLDLSQVEAGQMAIHRELVELRDVLNQAVNVVQPLVQMKGLSLRVEIADDLPPIHCDRTRIRQVILNLVSNAARFTDAGSITIRAERKGMFVRLGVIDTGTGIAPEDTERIFEPFYQAARGHYAARSGTGLGLSISKQFVELHGGRMWLHSTLGVGSEFLLELPIWSSEQAPLSPARWLSEEWQWQRHRAPVPAPEVHLDQRYVICEPGMGLLPLARRQAPDWEFVGVADLPAAQQVLEAAPAQALVFNAPDVGTLMDRLRLGLALVPDTPLLGCTLSVGLGDERLATVARYLIKPFKRSDLEQAVRDALGKEPLTVLLVDDDADTVRLVQRLLEVSFPEVTVYTASDGRSGLAALSAHRPDVLLLDVILPDMGGWALLEAKKGDAAVRDIPVIMVSAQDPQNRPPTSCYLVAAMPNGISLNRLLRCWQWVARCLQQPERSLYPEPQ